MGTKTQKLSNVVDQIVEWQSVVVADGSTNTTGVSGRGYFVDASAGAHTINLPASPKIGDVVKVSLIASGNTLTIGRNGNNINGNASDITTSADGDMFELVYINASEGWKTVGQINAGTFISATGGTVTTSTDYKIHTFTGDGCFVVSSLGNIETNPQGGPNTVDYLVVAGGGGGGGGAAPSSLSSAGGGAGGFRESKSGCTGCWTASPLVTPTGLTITTTTYPITVGGGGSGGPTGEPAGVAGSDGSNSVFSTITSTGGGGGAARNACIVNGRSGGSGGGGVTPAGSGGSGNTPPTSPSQGNSGGGSGCGAGNWSGGGGGGATVAGDPGIGTPGGGGDGATSSINGTPTARAGGGGGGGTSPCMPTLDGGFGGSGGGGNGGPTTGSATAGSTNTGGGGGGAASLNCGTGAAGGKGIVIIRYKYQ